MSLRDDSVALPRGKRTYTETVRAVGEGLAPPALVAVTTNDISAGRAGFYTPPPSLSSHPAIFHHRRGGPWSSRPCYRHDRLCSERSAIPDPRGPRRTELPLGVPGKPSCP